MTTITVELPQPVYERLSATARQEQKTVEIVVQEWIIEKSASQPAMSERDRATQALRAAGLLTELSPEGKAWAARTNTTLAEVSDALEAMGGKPLSDLVLEMRGPKEHDYARY